MVLFLSHLTTRCSVTLYFEDPSVQGGGGGERAGSPEMLVTTNQTTRRRIPITATERLHYIRYITVFWANIYMFWLIAVYSY
jgi:hypothetical protein